MNVSNPGKNRSSQSACAAKLLTLATVFIVTALQTASATQADDTSIIKLRTSSGAKPFIRKLNFKVTPIANLKSVQFIVQPKPGSVTRPLSATYSIGYLSRRGFLDSAGNLKVPVFGLYDEFANTITLNYFFNDDSSTQRTFSVLTGTYHAECGYKKPTVVKPRTRSTSLSYDFMLLKNRCSNDSPAILDTDGALRWVGTAGLQSYSNAFFDNAVYIGTTPGSQLLRMELDGMVSLLADYGNIGVTSFHHNIDRGKYGLLLEVNTATDIESVILEVDKDGNLLKQWNMALLIAKAMRDAGDDPSAFVRRGKDWFHNNAVTYRASDDSLIISSRENFVIALDYGSGAIKWILGDTSKAWYQYPSLRRYALTVPSGGVAPIGQHSVSITYNDKLLLFDNGLQSWNQIPPGNSRTFAAPRKYALNLNFSTARQIFSYNAPIISQICSSVYEDGRDNYLIDYAVAGGYLSSGSSAEIVGLQADGEKVFDYKYYTTFCDKIFNAFPIHLEQLSFH